MQEVDFVYEYFESRCDLGEDSFELLYYSIESYTKRESTYNGGSLIGFRES